VTVWLDVDERVDHYLGLPRANIVAAETLLTTRDNLADVVNARAMMCVLGDAGLSNTLSVNASLLTLAPEDVYRVRFQARPTPRDIRHVLFDALGIEAVARPNTPIRMTWAGGRGPAPTLRGPVDKEEPVLHRCRSLPALIGHAVFLEIPAAVSSGEPVRSRCARGCTSS
jgi:hypothetical protein